MEAQPILCFQHCTSRSKVFCFELPKKCPLCGCDLYSPSTELLMPPFRVPFPFKAASKLSCSVVIKPTNTDFLFSYNNSCNLHVGVTDSRGTVYEYKKEGICNIETRSWDECLEVEVIKNPDRKIKDLWNSTLNNLISHPKWSSALYNEDDHNCYQFVLTFLRNLRLHHLESYLHSKMTFCQQFIVPQTTMAAKYITLFRRILSESVVVQNLK